MSFPGAVQKVRRVLVVDDSRTIRAWMKHVLEQDAALQVVGEAADASEAAKLLKTCDPDVMTLDVEMPGQSGLDFLRDVMSATPMPVVMVSSLTARGSDAAIKALTRGAVDCIAKPDRAGCTAEEQNLRRRVLIASRASVGRVAARQTARPGPAEARPAPSRSGRPTPILIGSSTGGVAALETVFEGLENTACPVVVAQHMPENFLNSFCLRLNSMYAREFVMAQEGLVVGPGMCVISSGSQGSTYLKPGPRGWRCHLGPVGRNTPYHPCIDDLFESAAQPSDHPVVAAAILTGMGKDGAEGLAALKDAGAYTLAQDEATSTVYGMPRAAAQIGAAHEVLPIDKIGPRLAEKADRGAARRGAAL